MDYGKILARAFEITRKYRALWLFGVLLALFGGSSANFNFPNYSFDRRDRFNGNVLPQITTEMQQTIVVIIIALACLALVWLVLSIILRFVSRGALIGLVNELETEQVTPTVRRGFGIGANRFWPLLGIALTINIPLMLVSMGVILCALVPLALSIIPLATSGGHPADELVGVAVTGILGSIGLICCVALVLAAIGFIIHPFYEFITRVCVIGKRGVFDSIREGYRIVRANLGNVFVLYILMIAVGIGFAILMIPVALILIGIPTVIGLIVGFAAQSVLPGVVTGLVIGIPMLLILLFISGLYHAFSSTIWTEGYLAVTAPKTTAVEPAAPAAA